MIFYAFSENEILRLNDDIDLLEDLRAAAKYAYIERLLKEKKQNLMVQWGSFIRYYYSISVSEY